MYILFCCWHCSVIVQVVKLTLHSYAQMQVVGTT